MQLPPGSLAVVRPVGDARWRERRLLRPIRKDHGRGSWVTGNARGEPFEEEVRNWGRVHDLRRGYPEARGEVEQFLEMVDAATMTEKLEVGWAEARRLRYRYGSPLELGGAFGSELGAAVGWDGQSIEVPDMEIRRRARHRLTGKRPALAPPAPIADKDPSANTPTGRRNGAGGAFVELAKPATGLEVPQGMMWIGVDPGIAAAASSGTTLSCTPRPWF